MTRWIVQFSTTLTWAAELKNSHSAADPDGGMRECNPPPCHRHAAFVSVKYRQSLAYLALSLANCYNQSRLLDLNSLKKARARNGELTALPQTLQLNLRGRFAAGKGKQRRDKSGRNHHHHHHIFVYLEVDKRNSYKLYKYTNKGNRKMVND